MTHEWPVYAFDAVLMAMVLVICYFWYLGKFDFPELRETSDDYEMMRSASPYEETGYART